MRCRSTSSPTTNTSTTFVVTEASTALPSTDRSCASTRTARAYPLRRPTLATFVISCGACAPTTRATPTQLSSTASQSGRLSGPARRKSFATRASWSRSSRRRPFPPARRSSPWRWTWRAASPTSPTRPNSRPRKRERSRRPRPLWPHVAASGRCRPRGGGASPRLCARSSSTASWAS